MRAKTRSRTSARKLSRPPVLAFDLGGTKVEAGIVDPTGKILRSLREPVAASRDSRSVLDQMARLGRPLIEEWKPSRGGIASAGPLDPGGGVLLDPTNFGTAKNRWGRVAITRELEARLGIGFRLENDAAASALAEAWVGAGRGVANFVVLTLGTGLGTAVFANGALVRAGRGLHTEAGHLILHAGAKDAPCGCGNQGCAEAYLSATGFAGRFNRTYSGRARDAALIARLARRGDLRAVVAFAEYADLLAALLHDFSVVFAPELIVLTGSFAAASDLFLAPTRARLEVLLARRRQGVDFLPRVELSPLGNEAGLLGGARVAFGGAVGAAGK